MPWTQFDARNQLYNENTSVSQLEPWKETGQPPSFVIDAIDNIESKVALLAQSPTSIALLGLFFSNSACIRVTNSRDFSQNIGYNSLTCLKLNAGIRFLRCN